MKYLVQVSFNKMLDEKGLPLSEVVMVLAAPGYVFVNEQIQPKTKVKTVRFFADAKAMRDMAGVLKQQAKVLEKFSEDYTLAVINEYRQQLEKVDTHLENMPGEEDNAGAEQSNAG